jgi:hypothetical protein
VLLCSASHYARALHQEQRKQQDGAMAKRLCTRKVCLDVFALIADGGERGAMILCDEASGLPALAAAAVESGGRAFQYTLDSAHMLEADLVETLGSVCGADATVRVRCSEGFGVSEYVGKFSLHSSAESGVAEAAGIDRQTKIGVVLKHEGEGIPAHRPAFLQCAVLYTDQRGLRRVRVQTVSIPVAQSTGQAFEGVSSEALIAFLARMLSARILAKKLSVKEARARIASACVRLVSLYRQTCSREANRSDRLVLCETLQYFPFYTLAVLRWKPFLSEAVPDRCFELARLCSLHDSSLLELLYPVCFSVDFTTGQATRLPLSRQAVEACPHSLLLVAGNEQFAVSRTGNISVELAEQISGRPGRLVSVRALDGRFFLDDQINDFLREIAAKQP